MNLLLSSTVECSRTHLDTTHIYDRLQLKRHLPHNVCTLLMYIP